MKKYISIVLFLMGCCQVVLAQAKPADWEQTLRSNGKIYVVTAVVLTILAGLLLYVIRLDRKISRIEKTNNPNK